MKCICCGDPKVKKDFLCKQCYETAQKLKEVVSKIQSEGGKK